jgi:uncharacterized lipoprotein YddW (UPF0748 family)
VVDGVPIRRASREYFDIGLPELHDHVAGMVRDIAVRSAVDGVHLDYVRYDGPQWGTTRVPSSDSRRRPPPRRAGAGERVWADWRRAQSRAIVERARAALAGAGPKLYSVRAVIAQGARPRRDLRWASPGPRRMATTQDCRLGVDGLLDLAVPMMYMRESVTEHAHWYRHGLAFAAD